MADKELISDADFDVLFDLIDQGGALNNYVSTTVFKGKPVQSCIFAILMLREGVLRSDPGTYRAMEKVFEQIKDEIASNSDRVKRAMKGH